MARMLGLLGFFLVTGTIASVLDADTLNISTFADPAATYSCNGLPQACSGCQTVEYCTTFPNGSVSSLSTDTCAGSTPYCNATTGTCQSTVTQNCMQSMSCTSYGLNFPIPNQCNSYLQCLADGTQTMSVCKNASIPYFSPTTGTCQKTAVACAISCPATSQKNVPFTSDNRYYAACMNGLPKLVYKCRPPTTFSATLGYCTMSCPGVAMNFANPSNCRSYLQCKVGTATATAQQCPDGQKFDMTFYECNNSTTALTVQPCSP